MAQFTVYRNKNPRSKAAFPLLLDVQTDLLDGLQTRVVVPLSKAAALAKKPLSQLTPPLEVDGETYLMMTPQLAGIDRNELGAATGSLADRRETIIAALEFLVTGF